MTYAQMAQYRDFLPKVLYMPASMWPAHESQSFAPAVEAAQKEFFAAFKAASINPDNGASLAWDPAMVVIDALNKLPGGASAAQLRSYLATAKGFAGVNGLYDFAKVPQRGLDEEDCVVTLWDSAKKAWKVVSEPAGIPIKRGQSSQRPVERAHDRNSNPARRPPRQGPDRDPARLPL